MTSTSLEAEAIEGLAPRKFHQIFTVPATDAHEILKVTYSIAGIDEGDDVPTILFCGGMFGTRWQATFMDWMATRDRVRILFIDRPGFGGSTPVKLSQRLQIFLETVPLLLAHLNIKHISIATQSAGTIYGLNLLSHRPDLLSPTNPSITCFSPWVHQSHTSVSFLHLASMLPNTLFNYWNKLTGFMINSAQPAFAVSGGAITAVSSAFKSKVATEEQKKEEAMKCTAGYNMSLELKAEVDKLVFKYVFEENTTGANEEARFCLKSVPGTGWDACEDYEQYLRNLVEVWDKKVEEGASKLKVNIVLPEEDIMVGDKGMSYFEECWREEKCGNGIEVEISKLKGSDHDSTADPSEPALGKMFAQVKESRA